MVSFDSSTCMFLNVEFHMRSFVMMNLSVSFGSFNKIKLFDILIRGTDLLSKLFLKLKSFFIIFRLII